MYIDIHMDILYIYIFIKYIEKTTNIMYRISLCSLYSLKVIKYQFQQQQQQK